MKRVIILLIALAVLISVFASCGSNVSEMEIGVGEETVTVQTDGLTDEQVEALQDVADGESQIMSVMQGGLFTSQELSDLGLMGDMGGRGNMPNMPDMSDIDMDSLTLDGLSEEQVQYIPDVIDGEKTIQSLTDDDVLTMPEIQQIGLMGDKTRGDKPVGGMEQQQ